MQRIVKFIEEGHRYEDQHGRAYVAVSALLARAYPFDRQAIARKVSADPRSRYHGQPVEVILAGWDKSAEDGTGLHKAIQQWIETGEYPPMGSPDADGALAFAKGNWSGKLKSETILHSTALHLAGTADLLEEFDDRIDLWDIKTCRTIDQEKLLKYSLQLALYKTMAEETLTEKPVNVRGIIWYENYTENRSVAPQIIQPVPCLMEFTKLVFERMEEANGEKEAEIEQLLDQRVPAKDLFDAARNAMSL